MIEEVKNDWRKKLEHNYEKVNCVVVEEVLIYNIFQPEGISHYKVIINDNEVSIPTSVSIKIDNSEGLFVEKAYVSLMKKKWS